MKIEEKRQAVKLRKEGWSIKEIAKYVGVSQSSVSVWVRNIKLTESQRLRLDKKEKERSLVGLRKGTKIWSEMNKNRRITDQQNGRKVIENSSDLYKMGCMLYWGEGAKARNSVNFANSDPAMMVLFKKFLDEEFKVPEEKYRIKINTYVNNGMSLEDIETYWLDLLELNGENLQKSSVSIKHPMSTGRRKGKLLYGVCSLRVHDSSIVQQIFGSIKELANINDEEKWLW